MIIRPRSPRNHWPRDTFRHQTEINSRLFQIEIFNFVSNKKYKEVVTKFIHMKTDIQKLVYKTSSTMLIYTVTMILSSYLKHLGCERKLMLTKYFGYFN